MNRFGGMFLLVLATGLLLGSFVTARYRREAIKSMTTAEGAVVRLNAGGSHPEVQFRTDKGETVSYSQGGFIFGYRPGNRVRVLYEQNDPRRSACIDTFGALWFFPAMLALLGVVGLLASFFALRKS